MLCFLVLGSLGDKGSTIEYPLLYTLFVVEVFMWPNNSLACEVLIQSDATLALKSGDQIPFLII